MLDEHNLTTFVDRATAAILGYEAEEMRGRPIRDFIDATLDGALTNDLELNGSDLVSPRELQLRATDGRPVWTEVSANQLPCSAGRYEGAVMLVTDITERKANEAKIAQLAALVESSGEAIITVTPTGEIVTWNQAAQRLYGYTGKRRWVST